jgi:polyphosphate kinase
MNEPLAQTLLDDDLELDRPMETPAPVADTVSLDDPSLYLNRELTWLAFNRRVLHEADDPRTPLLERVKFLAIVSNNLDEFFMKRIGGLKQQIAAGVHTPSLDGRTPTEQLKLCHAVREMQAEQKRIHDELMAARGARHPDHQDRGPAERRPGSACASTSAPISSRC